MRWSLVLALMACGRPDTTPVGQVQDCDNGTYFSLKTQSCQTLWGYETRLDETGFESMHIANGVTVPRKINGQSPFLVTVAYNVSRPTSLEVVMKEVLFGTVGGDGLTDWQKLELEPGSGVRSLVLTPNYTLPKGRAAAYMDGRWTIDTGYMLEIKGGDRFEDEDADQIASWRVAGIQVDPEAPRDPAAKSLILGAMVVPDQIVGCQLIEIDLPVQRLTFAASFDLALKQPGSNWASYGGQTIRLEKGFEGALHFQFAAKSETGDCAPPGPPAQADASGQFQPGAYLFQLDIYTDDGGKLDKTSEVYTVPEGWRPVTVASAA
ncbi:MAG TPA: hypothetical protein VE954_25180 [Oligoflexus sp.]|uniref:hypothetical protein n=1 Tax=Oligoflexus sp. TaxID=1971216 RepID=UPI002D5AEF83|nr:hypothetical protein [Oligoflexus sp.]HYX36413.1 hypothetical protein [Oligoflexus sp.]